MHDGKLDDVAPSTTVGRYAVGVGGSKPSTSQTIAEKEESKRLSSVVTRIGSQANVTNAGSDVDPDRDIGHIGSAYKPEKSVPEWMKKRNSNN